MNSDIVIRRFKTKDAKAVIELWRDVLPASQPWNEPKDVLVRKLNQNDDLVFVAVQGTAIIGAVVAGYDGVRGWIYSLAVAAEHRRRGIGRKLMNEAESALLVLGCPKVNLQVRVTNEDVLEFYRRCGYLSEDRASMGKPLAKAASLPLNPLPTIKVTDQITLSAISLDDKAAYLKHLNETDEFKTFTSSIPYPYTDIDADQWMAKAMRDTVTLDRSLHWAIRNEGGEFLGSIGFFHFTKGEKAEIGYWLAKSYWGQGIMTKAVRCLSEFGFDHYGLRKVHAKVFATNPSSAKVLTKAGFELEGTLRNHFFQDGEPIDVLMFGLLTAETSTEGQKQKALQAPYTIDPAPTSEEVASLDARLGKYNTKQTGRDDFKPVHLVVRDEGGNVIAGLKGVTGWDWLYVEILWVDENTRRTGIGSQLLKAAEEEARERGCIGSCLSSYNFQAPDFYEQNGYSSFGRIENYPDDNTMFFMSKRFRS